MTAPNFSLLGVMLTEQKTEYNRSALSYKQGCSCVTRWPSRSVLRASFDGWGVEPPVSTREDRTRNASSGDLTLQYVFSSLWRDSAASHRYLFRNQPAHVVQSHAAVIVAGSIWRRVVEPSDIYYPYVTVLPSTRWAIPKPWELAR